MARLFFVLEDGEQEVPLADRLSLGRAEDNDVVVDDERMSRHHSEIVCHADGRVEVMDLGSRTGTKVNGATVKSQMLRNGDEIVFGPLHARIEMDAPATPEPAKKPKAEPADDASSAEKQRLSEEIETLRQELADWRSRAGQERAEHETKLRMLRTAEERLGPIQAAAAHAENTHREWLAAIEELSAEHKETTALLTKSGEELEAKQAALKKVESETEAARGELATLTEQQKSLLEKVSKAEQTQSEAATAVERLRREATELEAKVGEQRRLGEELEARIAKSQSLADQKTSEAEVATTKVKELLEEQGRLQPEVARMKTELADWSGRLADTRQQCGETETRLAEAGAALEKVQTDLAAHEKRLSEAAALTETREAEARAAVETLTRLQEQQAAAEAGLTEVQAKLTAEEAALAGLTLSFAETDGNLRQAKKQMAEAEVRLAQLSAAMPAAAKAREVLAGLEAMCTTTEESLEGTRSALKELEKETAAKQASLRQLAADEEKARKSLDELAGRESALKAEVSSLTAVVREKQSTLDEIRILGARQEETARAIELARNEIASLTARLTPLREWKDAMDLLYARFADLPQASPEAQEVWREIETGKAKLRQYIISTQTRVPRIMHIEFSKEGLKPRQPMKSERMRGKANGKKV